MCLGQNVDFFVDGKKINSANRCKYLGSFISKDCTLKDELLTRKQSTSSAHGRLKKRVSDNYDLTLKTEVSVYIQCLIPILLYGSETWTLYVKEIKELRTIQLRHLRLIMKIKWDVLKREGEEVLFAENRLHWLGHVARMDDSRMVKLLLFGELADGTRTVGRPRLRFKDSCKNLIKIGGSLDHWTELIVDRV